MAILHVSDKDVRFIEVMINDVDEIDLRCPRDLDKDSISQQEWELSPFNKECLAHYFSMMESYLRRYSDWEVALYTAVYVLISACAVLGNGIVILAFLRKREMRTNRNVLIVNLALSNLMLAVTNIPFLWLPSVDFQFPYSRYFCKFANALPGCNIYCSTLTISVMAIDQYYSVKNIKTKTAGPDHCLRAVFMSVSIWFISLLLSFPLLFYYDTSALYIFKDVIVSNKNNGTELASFGWVQCRIVTSMNADERSSGTDDGLGSQGKAIQLFVSMMQVLFIYIIPLVVLSIFNIKLNRFLKSRSMIIAHNRNPCRLVKDQSASSSLLHMVSEGDPSDSHRESSIFLKGRRRRSRTAALLFAMAASFAILWSPFTAVSLLIDLNVLEAENSADIIERVDQSCKVLSIMSICINPVLYGFLNTNFRHEFTEMFNEWIRCRERLPHQTNREIFSLGLVDQSLTDKTLE
ncbi:hypothetical protein AB6A40_005819 [Gnathostoma spinigerum]|uniref:G-protein coupled receptors family 1 profile domain-containing protein n=1 Tax=Gnathostoma spinigerum TaxID=75299 RepID=A0ABD6ES79_9BILA